MKKWKQITALALSLVVTMGLFTGCSGESEKTEGSETNAESKNEETGSENSEGTEEAVELIWYTRFDDQADTEMINEALNKLTMEKINCTVDLVNIPGGSYNDKLQVILAGREECDVVFAGTSFADFWGNAARGAFLPLDDLLANQGKESYDAIPETLWDGVKLNDEIYGVINYQIVAKEAGIYVPTEFLDKYEFDLSTVKNFKDAEPLLEKIHKDNPDLIPAVVNDYDFNPWMGFDEIGTAGSVGAVVIGDDTLTAVNQYELEGFKEHAELMYEWNKKGYLAPDVATITSYNDLIKAGKVGMMFNNIKPGGEEQEEILWGKDLTTNTFVEGRVLSSAVSATVNCISSTSKNPEKAMEFINLLNTDKEVYNLVCYGIEDTHYTKIDENRIEFMENSGYQPNKSWSMGNQFNAYIYGTQSDDVWEQTIQLNEEASISGLLGFVFDIEPVKSQVAQCQSIVDQYWKSIYRGAVDPAEYLPEFIEKLEAAGSNEIIAEQQVQIDAWKNK